MSIDFIYFDLGKVIFEFDHDIACRKIAKHSGLTADRVKSVVFDSGLEERYETGLVSSEQFVAEFCQVAGVEYGQAEFLHAIGDVFEPNRPIFPLIAQLRARNYPIGILSNTCEAHWDFVYKNYAILRGFFEPLILSYEVNSMKPDSKIYERAIEQAGCFVKKCFFVDDKQENVDGAIAAGMDAVLYESVGKLIQDLDDRGVEVNL
jgi:HAD superfamily hydrolase (TIGR01509 family)